MFALFILACCAIGFIIGVSARVVLEEVKPEWPKSRMLWLASIAGVSVSLLFLTGFISVS